METSSHTVLVVDDNQCIRVELVGLLTDEGYDAVGAANGKEALAYMRSVCVPVLILLDINMPVMDGLEFYQQKQHDRNLSPIPIVVISADRSINGSASSSGEHSLESLALREHAIAWLSKPFDIEQFLVLVEQFCGPSRRISS